MNIGMILVDLSILATAAVIAFLVLHWFTRKDTYAVNSRVVYYIAASLIFVSFIHLLYLFISNDFRISYVYNNSSIELPLVYKITALWSGQEGSFLLWVLILALVGITIMNIDRENLNILLLPVAIAQLFILITLFIKSPFDFIWTQSPDLFGIIPENGSGMNPLLQDPWMVTHPPFLYVGYATAIVPFGYAIASFIKNDYSLLIKKGYTWVLVSFLTLGIGIFMGGYWAYTVLGWGGYWGWDPVENSSLVPWLIVIALVHGIVLQRRTRSLIKTNLFFSMFYIVLVLFSFFLTRSGILANFSVHSFVDYGLSVYLAAYVVFFLAVSAAIFVWKYKSVHAEKMDNKIFSQSSMTLLGILILVLYSLFILFGTCLPILSGLVSTHQASADSGFYNSISTIFGPAILVLMIFATSVVSPKNMKRIATIIIFVISVIAGSVLNSLYSQKIEGYIMAILCFFLILHNLYGIYKNHNFSILPSRISHIGVGILLLGITSSHLYSNASQNMLYKDQEKTINSVPVTFLGIEEQKITHLKISVKHGTGTATALMKYYFNERMNSIYREPFIISTLSGDIYIAVDNYLSGMNSVTIGLLKKGEEKTIGGMKVTFVNFFTSHMTSEEPSISASLIVNGAKLSPKLYLKSGEKVYEELKIPGSDRDVSLLDIDASSKSILVYISPGKHMEIPADSVTVNVSRIRLIWLVWLGSVFIAAGGIMAIIKSYRRKN